MKRRTLALALPIALLAGQARAADAPATAGAGTPPVRSLVGPAAKNAAGQQGHLHTVVAGETLWDISEAYLGTPWIWPSLWKDDTGSGRDAAIRPGDVLWVSAVEIRRLTPAETAALRESSSAAPPAAMDADGSDSDVASAPVAGLDHWVEVQGMGFIASAARTEDFRGSAQAAAVGRVIGNPTSRAALGTGDVIYIDLGAGQVGIGERLRIVRAKQNVPDPDTGRLLGTFVEPLGWAEVTELEGEAASAVIAGAVDAIHVGDLLLPPAGPSDPASLRLESTPPGVRGEIVLMVGERVLSAGMDVVYLDKGTEAGLSPGSALEIVRPGRMLYDSARDRTVKVPDTVIAQMVVISARQSSAAAYVLHSTTDLARGDFYRGAQVR
ncbi:MAG: LysM peptidoglycan-binding domain-containing protein [Deltaproteobacteria bacterium]|nr:LysM peptidoglycan-binding domain-containing protein [Deltaproteobacteria bacterium]